VTPRLEDRVRRQARARAAAASIVDAPRVPRRFAPAEDAPLRASQRRRVRHHTAPDLALPISAISRRRLALAVLALQVVGLFAILVLPAFRASVIEVRGNRLLDRAAILAAARISDTQSLFTIDGEQVQQRLLQLPWVRSASVETDLPHTVRITVREWTPVLVLHRGAEELAIADDGSLLDLGHAQVPAPPGVPVVVDNRPQLVAAHAGGAAGQLDPTLVRTLVITAQRFRPVFGVGVNHFEWQGDGLFAIVTTAGWRAILGHMLSDADVAAVPDQLAALVSLRGRLDYQHPNFGYVDLENPQTPTVGGKPGPPDPVAAPTGGTAPTAAPAVSATPRPTPTPTPKPTPIQFVIGAPPGH